MKKLILLIFLIAFPCYSAEISIQGKLDATFTDTTSFGFALISDDSGVVWNNSGTWESDTEPTSWTSLSVTNGVFGSVIGDTSYSNMTGLDNSIFFDDTDISCRIWITESLQTPDIKITDVPYAIGSRGSFSVAGSYFGNTTNITSSTYDLSGSDFILNCDYTSTGEITSLTLPTSQCVNGRVIHIKDTGGDASSHNVTIDTEGAEKINGMDTFEINVNYTSVSLYSNGSNWFDF